MLHIGLGKYMFSYKTPRALSVGVARKCILPSQAVNATFKIANVKNGQWKIRRSSHTGFFPSEF